MANGVTDKNIEDFIKLLNKCDKTLYEYWITTYGYDLLNKWFDEHMYDANTFRSKDFAEYMTDNFSLWMSLNK